MKMDATHWSLKTSAAEAVKKRTMHADKQEDSGITLTIKFDDNRELRQDAAKLKIL